jgi:large subunit ribosomal protein L23
MSPYDAIRSPVVTEKAETIRALQNTLCFRVHPKATKTDIKNAVEHIFKIKVAGVRTAMYLGKVKRRGQSSGRKAGWKKAYVKLKEGEKMVEYAQV